MAECLHRSPSLTSICNSIKSSSKNHILDLGSCSPVNFRFFSTLGCRFHFAGLDESIHEFKRLSNELFSNRIDKLIEGIDSGRKFDMVLGWDLLNFLCLEKVVILFEKLNQFIKPDSLFHFYSYAAGQIPTKPGNFKVQDKYYLTLIIQESKNNTSRDYKPLTTASLLKSIPDYFMLHSYLNLNEMMHGFAEQILRFQPERSKRQTDSSSAEIGDVETFVDRKFFSPSIDLLRESKKRKTILDLGRKTVLNDDFWKRSYDNVYYADLIPVLKKLKTLSSTEKQEYLRHGTFLNFDDNLYFDVIVLWDLPNFISDTFLLELNRRLGKHCHSETKIVLMSHSGALKPRRPMPFLLTQDGLGFCSQQIPELRPRVRPAKSSFDWQKLLPAFVLSHTFAIRPGMLRGMIEYIFIYKETKKLSACTDTNQGVVGWISKEKIKEISA